MAESLEAQTILDPIPGPGPMVRGVLSEYVNADVQHFPRGPVKDTLANELPYNVRLLNNGTALVPEYVVTVTEGTVGEVTTQEGELIYHTAANHYSGALLAEHPIVANESVYLKINLDAEGAITSIELKVLPATIPAPDLEGALLYKIASFNGTALTHYLSKSNFIYRLGGGGGGGAPVEGGTYNHPWKVTLTRQYAAAVAGVPATEGPPPVAEVPATPEVTAQVTIAGGTVFSQGTDSDGLWVDGTTEELAVGSSYKVYLKIERDKDSRALGGTGTGVAPEIYMYVVGGTPPVSDSYYQYFEIADILASGGGEIYEIIQQRFHDFRVYEVVTVFNGAFRLVNLEFSGDNLYALP